ncbi:MAG TPA: MarR family transcriptional regulator [Rugosimonospora sp.]|nr:MarR family transcriptional regulator [Rugosimonospora sp.]
MTDPLANQLMEELNGVRRVVRRRLRARLGSGLSGSQVELLRAVEANPGTGVAAAAQAMHLAANSVSALVYQLVDAGYLRRETDPNDRRAARLQLTPTARRRLDAWRSDRGRLVGEGLAQLSASDRTAIDRALPALGRLAAILDALDDPATPASEAAGPAALPRKRTGVGRG